MEVSGATEAFTACEAIAEDRALASQTDAFGDGYRSAARDIALAIRAKRQGRAPTELERDIRDVEVESRTLARVVAVAAAVVDYVDPHATPADAIRRVLLVFFTDDDLPSNLRRPPPCESTTRLVVEGKTGMDAASRLQDAGARIGARPRKARRRAD
jgi:hypothetical protein